MSNEMNSNQNDNLKKTKFDRRNFLSGLFRTTLLGSLGVFSVTQLFRPKSSKSAWQIVIEKCNHCGLCATRCVTTPSAVKCIHTYEMCGYCELCFGYFQPGAPVLNEGAENQLCPTGAIKRKYIEEPYFQYSIERSLCIGCAKCVKGCVNFGNGSLHLQVDHAHCLNCNECAIAKICPTQAIVRVSAEEPYLSSSTYYAK